MTAPIPFAPGAARAFLIGKPQFTTLLPAANLTTRDIPDPLNAACMTIRATGNTGVDPMLRRPMLQLDAWAPKRKVGDTLDPEELSWDIAALAGQLLGRARNIAFKGSAWSGEWIEGPMTFIDTKRGVDLPLYRSMIRVELKMRAPRA